MPTLLDHFCRLRLYCCAASALAFAGSGSALAAPSPSAGTPPLPTAGASPASSSQPAQPGQAASPRSTDAPFVPVATPLAAATTTVFNVTQVLPIAVLGVQGFPQALWQGGAPVASPETIVYSNGVVLYDWGTPARAEHGGYNPSKTYYDAASEETITQSYRIWKVAQLTQAQLASLVRSLHEPDLDKLDKTVYHYDKLPHYLLSYWPNDGGKPKTITVGGPLYSGDCDDSFFKTFDLQSLHGANDFEIDDARSHTPKPLLSAIDFLQFYDVKQAEFPDPNTYFLQLDSASSSKAQPWPDSLPEIVASDLKPVASSSDSYTADLEEEQYESIKSKLAQSPKNNVYLINGKPMRVKAVGVYTLPALPQVIPVLIDRSDEAAGGK